MLAKSTPDRLWLTKLSTKGTSIAIDGESLDNELVALFLRRLGESDYFDDVDLDSTQLANSGGLRVVKFKIHAQLVRPPDAPAQAS